MKTALVIMAAGIGSRFGGGIKQLEPVGLNGEIIMDYSIHDAIKAGFNKVVFIIRHDIEEAFKEAIGNRIEKICEKANVEIAYAFQELSDVPAGVKTNPERTKPYGTGHAILSAKNVIDCPFAVINADDYYGKEAFTKLYDYLNSNKNPMELCMAGFIIKNTLSDNGGVTRGICQMDNGYLTGVNETKNIVKDGDGASSEGKPIDIESLCSMNMWGLSKEFVDLLEKGFVDFFNTTDDLLKGEFLVPIYIDELIKNGTVKVKVLETKDKWFGVTYKEDKDFVVDSFKKLIEDGVYNKELFSDL